MTYLTVVRHVRHWSKEMMLALVVLFVTIAFYCYFGDITFVKGWEEGIYKVFFRFFRFTLFSLPISVSGGTYLQVHCR